MLRSEFEQAIGRAIVDSQFCAWLLTDPVDALTDYGLAAQEALSIQGLHSVSLADLVVQIASVGAQLWGTEFRTLLRELHCCLPVQRLVHVAGLVPISVRDYAGQLLESAWPAEMSSQN